MPAHTGFLSKAERGGGEGVAGGRGTVEDSDKAPLSSQLP